MKVEYGGRNVTFSDGDLSDNYTLEVNQSLIYIFTMYLQLADGHEMVFWNGELDLTPSPTNTGAYSITAKFFDCLSKGDVGFPALSANLFFWSKPFHE